MKLTKIDVAEAHLVSAVRLHFQGGHLASVYLLAASAREILTTIGDITGIETVLHWMAKDMGRPLKEAIAGASEHVNFLKHANRDPQATLETMDEKEVETLLLIACHDFGSIAKGQAIEMQVYEAWFLAQFYEKVMNAPLKFQPVLRAALRHFHGIKSMTRGNKLNFGWTKLQEALKDPALKMEIQQEVIIPDN